MISLQLLIVLGVVAFAAIQLALNVRGHWRHAMAKQKGGCGACTACPVAVKGQSR